jgi:hypothetical protein
MLVTVPVTPGGGTWVTKRIGKSWPVAGRAISENIQQAERISLVFMTATFCKAREEYPLARQWEGFSSDPPEFFAAKRESLH